MRYTATCPVCGETFSMAISPTTPGRFQRDTTGDGGYNVVLRVEDSIDMEAHMVGHRECRCLWRPTEGGGPFQRVETSLICPIHRRVSS